MKQFVFGFALLAMLASQARAGVILGTSGDLNMTTNPSAPMYVNVTSDNAPNDIMSAWFVQLQIAPITGSGTLTFQDPATGTPANPPNYIFGNGALATNAGISATNGGTTLSANDFTFSTGAIVLGTPQNLLQLDFSATAGTSGRFGIYAVGGGEVGDIINPALTYWTDSTATDQEFENIPGGDPSVPTVLIGTVDVNIASTIPEPSSVALLLLGSGVLAGCYRRFRGRA